MINILDNMIQELKVASNQARISRFIPRIRDNISVIMARKIPEIFYILTTMIAIELKQISPTEILSAIGKGMQVSQTCK